MEENQKKVKLYDAYSNADPIYENRNLTVVRYELITRKMLKRLDKSDALVLIAISPLETHGNFLPLGSDYIEALMMNELIKELLKERKSDKHYTIVEVPALPIGTGTLRGTKGSVDISHSVFRNVVEEYIEGYVKAGFTRFFLTSVHHGLIHALALEEVSVKLMKKYRKNGIRIVSPLNWIVKKIYMDNPEKTWKEVVKDLGQKGLKKEEYTALHQDHHSSIMEISFVKHINPQLVDDEYKNCETHVEGNLHGLKSLLSSKWANLGGSEGCAYNGHPSLANNRDWFKLYEKLVKDIGEEFIDALYDKDYYEFKKYKKSFMWPIFFLKTNFKWRFLTILIVCLAFIFYLPLFPWTLIPLIIFGIYLFIRILLVIISLNKD